MPWLNVLQGVLTNPHQLPKVPLLKNSQWLPMACITKPILFSLLSWPSTTGVLCICFLLLHNKYHKRSGLKQHPLIISQFPGAGVQARHTWVSLLWSRCQPGCILIWSLGSSSRLTWLRAEFISLQLEHSRGFLKASRRESLSCFESLTSGRPGPSLKQSIWLDWAQPG